MAQDGIIGHITLRIPIHAYTDRESWEIPEEYTYLEPGQAELVEHDMPAGWHAHMREALIESGTRCAAWTDEQIAETCTRTDPETKGTIPPELQGMHGIW